MATQTIAPEGALFEQQPTAAEPPFAAAHPEPPAEEAKQEPTAPMDASLLDRAVAETMAQNVEMKSALADMRVRAEQLKLDNQLAKVFAASGQFDDLRKCTPTQAIASALLKIELGRSYRLAPAQAMAAVYLVNGRPSIQSEVLGALMKIAGYDWVIETMTDEGCTILPRKNGQYIWDVARDSKGAPQYEEVTGPDGKKRMEPKLTPARVSFMTAQAKAAGLIKDKSAWQTYPSDMCFWRCIARMKRRYATEVGINLPTIEEAQEEAVQAGPQRPNLPVGNRPDGTVAVDKVA